MSIAERIERVRETAAKENTDTLRERFNARLDYQRPDGYTKFRDWDRFVDWSKSPKWASFGGSLAAKW